MVNPFGVNQFYFTKSLCLCFFILGVYQHALIIVDECHRGSAKADSEWRKILNYFDSAVHIGMTATPKETKEVSSVSVERDSSGILS